MDQLIFVGNSHLGALVKAVVGGGFSSKYKIKFILANNERYLPNFISATESLNPVLQSELSDYLDTNCQSYVFTLFAGNAHVAMGFSQNPKKAFDFVVPGYEYLPNIPKARMVPYRNIRDALYQRMLPVSIKPLLRVHEMVGDVPVYQLDAPPPIPSSEYILTNNNSDGLAEQINKYGLSSKEYRLKFWLMHSQVIQEVCDSEHIKFVPVPVEMIDEEGFLLEKGWYTDAVHANACYGASMLNSIERMIEEMD